MSSASEQKSAPDRKSAVGKKWVNVFRVLVGVLLAIGAVTLFRILDSTITDVDVALVPHTIAADGTSSAVLHVRLLSRFGTELDVSALPFPPSMEIVQGQDLVRVVRYSDSLTWRLQAGFETGQVVIRTRVFGLPAPVESTLELIPSLADRNGNGYPDQIDLTSRSDRTAFRNWFTAIAYGQLTHLDDRWHDRDCAGLLRYCYREALKRHDSAWLASRRWLSRSDIPDVSKYNYPDVPLVGTRIFNAGRRPSQTSGNASEPPAARPIRTNSTSGPELLDNFYEFAEASRLKDNSLAFLSRSPQTALPGDVIFYLNDTNHDWPYHTMVYLGNGRVVYHTGPDGDDPGIVKSLTLADLATHPNSRWHPVAANPYFLGFYRWRILE